MDDEKNKEMLPIKSQDRRCSGGGRRRQSCFGGHMEQGGWTDLSPFLAVGFKSLIAHLFYAPFCIILIEVLKKKQWEATVEIHGDSE